MLGSANSIDHTEEEDTVNFDGGTSVCRMLQLLYQIEYHSHAKGNYSYYH